MTARSTSSRRGLRTITTISSGGGWCGGLHGHCYGGGGGYTTVTYGQAKVLIGRGDGTFTTGASFRLGSSVQFGIAAADFNGDGWDDFAVGNGDSGGVDVYLNHGDGDWFFGGSYATGAVPFAITAADL